MEMLLSSLRMRVIFVSSTSTSSNRRWTQLSHSEEKLTHAAIGSNNTKVNYCTKWATRSANWPKQPLSLTSTHLSRHWSHLAPVTPGRHVHWPVCASQVTADSKSHWHPTTYISTFQLLILTQTRSSSNAKYSLNKQQLTAYEYSRQFGSSSSSVHMSRNACLWHRACTDTGQSWHHSPAHTTPERSCKDCIHCRSPAHTYQAVYHTIITFNSWCNRCAVPAINSLHIKVALVKMHEVEVLGLPHTCHSWVQWR